MSTNTLSLSGSNDGYVVNLATGTYAAAATVMPLGDSLTHGFLTPRDDDPDLDIREGYRGDLFDLILGAGGWIDYVGSTQNGPEDMLDPDHSATGGEELWHIVGNDDILSDLSDNLAEHQPDITLFMAGTNDFGTDQFENRFDRIVRNMETAINQFESYAGTDDKYMVISTLAPKIRDGIPPEYADMINRGYSVVGGDLVAGNLNGTYKPGLIAVVEDAHDDNPNIILHNNPVGQGDLSYDEVHYTNSGYAKYAASLMSVLQSEIGLVDGTFVNDGQSTGGAENVEGGEAGDRIIGNGQANTVEGNGGRDHITLGGGADVVVYGASALDDMRDLVTDLKSADTIDLSGIAAALGLSAAGLLAKLRFDEDSGGTELAVETSGSVVRLAYFEGASESVVRSAISIDGDGSGGDDGNDDTGNDDTGNDDTGNDDTGNDDTGNDDTGNDDTGNDDTGGPVDGQLFGTNRQDTIVDGDDSTEMFGLDSADTMYGGAGNDILEGGEGRDHLYGGTGGDIFRFTTEDGDGQRDNIFDFNAAEGDKIDITPLGEAFDLTSQQLKDIIDVDFVGNGIRISFSYGDFSENLAILKDLVAADVDDVVAAIITEAPDGGGDEPDEPVDTSADEDGNLAISVPDTQINESEAPNVVVSVSGIDADATAVVFMSYGGTTLTRSLAADGQVSFDLSALPDGAYTTAVTVTDSSANQKSVNGATVVLSTPAPAPTDTTADENGDLDITAPDTQISAAEVGNVAFQVSGLDNDATAEIVVSDGTGTVTETGISSNGTVVLNLSGLSDGPLTVSIAAADYSGNETGAIAGPMLTLDTSTSSSPQLLGTNGRDVLRDVTGDIGTEIYGFGGKDKLIGLGGNDGLFGGAGKDNLKGGTGKDILEGGTGRDVLLGQGGADCFVFNLDGLDGNVDAIKGWNAGQGDVIDISGISAAEGWSAAEAASHISFVDTGKHVRVELDVSEVNAAFVQLNNRELSDISLDDFILV